MVGIDDYLEYPEYLEYMACGVYTYTQQKVISLMRESTPNKILIKLVTSNSESDLSHVKLTLA